MKRYLAVLALVALGGCAHTPQIASERPLTEPEKEVITAAVRADMDTFDTIRWRPLPGFESPFYCVSVTGGVNKLGYKEMWTFYRIGLDWKDGQLAAAKITDLASIRQGSTQMISVLTSKCLAETHDLAVKLK